MSVQIGWAGAEVREIPRTHSGVASQAPVVTTYASDSFDRADGPLGNAEVGGAWVELVPTWGILANEAKVTAGAGSRIAYLDDLQSDGVWRVTLRDAASQRSLVIRIIDVNNYIYIQANGATNFRIVRFTAGFANTIGTYAVVPALNDVMKVVAVGSDIKLYVNDILGISATEAQGQTATLSGLLASSTSSKYNDYSHKSA